MGEFCAKIPYVTLVAFLITMVGMVMVTVAYNMLYICINDALAALDHENKSLDRMQSLGATSLGIIATVVFIYGVFMICISWSRSRRASTTNPSAYSLEDMLIGLFFVISILLCLVTLGVFHATSYSGFVIHLIEVPCLGDEVPDLCIDLRLLHLQPLSTPYNESTICDNELETFCSQTMNVRQYYLSSIAGSLILWFGMGMYTLISAFQVQNICKFGQARRNTRDVMEMRASSSDLGLNTNMHGSKTRLV